MSGHADYEEITQWLKQSELKPNTAIQLVHGELGALETFRDHLMQTTSFDVDVADYQGVYHL
ncbi:MBL fold metallo-hydrolase RNA specificity domain-containing protein [uncultured Idiomarina sp.]|uniref:MBL fold metallo-hydrolase RNA specificity domain-containing protein n=1 Tax=uncultured Idiomarina sp. TaxID=352961 RepID=UPI0025913CB9|nr:MBL fold metallo-hydrolase RNA specificity domain-containing protein [uncultured Idiomarina sp.]